MPVTKWTITNLETDRRESVSVDELFVLARALGVAPVHPLVPVDDDAHVSTTPTDTAVARHVRRWVTGDQPWAGSEADTYWSEAPDGWRDRFDDLRRRIEARVGRAVWTAVERATNEDGTVDADQLERELFTSLGSNGSR